MMKNSFDTSVLSYTQKTDDITLDSKLTDSLWCYVHIENFSLQVVTEKTIKKDLAFYINMQMVKSLLLSSILMLLNLVFLLIWNCQ